ncbi:MAG: glycosyltransferase family 4 protein [Polyangiales bacterium]
MKPPRNDSTQSIQRGLRVGILVPYDISEPGGGVKHHAFDLAASLRKMGDEVTILAPASAPIVDPNVIAFSGIVNVVSNGSDNKMAVFIPPWRVRKAIRELDLDILHVHEPLVPALTYWASWFSPGVPKIATFHCYAEDPPAALKAGHKVWGPTIFPLFRRGIAVSEAAAKYARIAWRDPLEIIGNGIDLRRFPVGLPIAASKPLKLLFVGNRSDERKGFGTLLTSFRDLRSRGVPVTLHVVGGGAEMAAEEGLTDHGAVSFAQLVRHYQTCDVFVAPSLGQESFGIVLLEAMACARPIVCSDIEGYRAVAHRDGALLVPPRDVGALTSAIESLVDDVDRRKQMSHANRRHAAAFDWNVLAPRIRRLYEEVIAEARGVTVEALPMAAE